MRLQSMWNHRLRAGQGLVVGQVLAKFALRVGAYQSTVQYFVPTPFGLKSPLSCNYGRLESRDVLGVAGIDSWAIFFRPPGVSLRQSRFHS